MNVLVALVAGKGEVVTRDELIDRVWNGAAGADQSVNQAISRLRSVLGDSPFEREFIETVPKRGYRLIADIALPRPDRNVDDAPAVEAKMDDEVRQMAAPRPDGISQSEQTAARRRSWAVIAILMSVILAVIYQFTRTTGPAETPNPTAFTKAIAVLPFEDMSPDGDQEYFSDGLSEELLSALGQIPDLKVVGRTSSFSFRGQDKDLREIGSALGASHILEGSVRKYGDRLRITVQLVKAEDGFRLWSATYDRNSTEIFDIQDEISNAVTEKLKLTLYPDTHGKPAATFSSKGADVSVFDLYLLARSQIQKKTRPALEEGLGLLEEVLAQDPTYAPALAAKGEAYIFLSDAFKAVGDIPVREARDLARPLIEKAIELEPNFADAYVSLALLREYEGDWNGSTAALKQAIEINPNLARAHLRLATINWDHGRRKSEIMPHFEQAAALDPLDPITVLSLAKSYFFTPGRREEGWALLRRAKSLFPGNRDVHGAEVDFLRFETRLADAINLVLSNPDYDLNYGPTRFARADLWYNVGAHDRPLELMPKYYRPVLHLLADEPEQAIAAVTASLENRDDLLDDALLFDVAEAARIYLHAGRPDLAQEILEPLAPTPKIALERFGYSLLRKPNNPSMTLAVVYRMAGDEDRAQAFAAAERTSVENSVAEGWLNGRMSYAQARLHAFDGEYADAIKKMAQAVEQGYINPLNLDYPLFDKMQNDPDYIAVRARQREIVNRERIKLGMEPLPAIITAN